MKKSLISFFHFIAFSSFTLITATSFGQAVPIERFIYNSAAEMQSPDSNSWELTYSVPPLSWVELQVLQQNKDVTIRWTTSTVTNVKKFEIEVSSNGKDWSVIMTDIHAYSRPGISSYEKTYTVRRNKKMCFRIRYEEFDGSGGYSPIVKAIAVEKL